MLSELVSDVVIAEEHGNRMSLRIEIRGDSLHVEVSEGALAYKLRSRRPEPGEPGWGPLPNASTCAVVGHSP